jgi:hypothetical protein
MPDVLVDMADKGLDCLERAATQPTSGSGPRTTPLLFSQGAPVGVKCSCTVGCGWSQAWTAGVEWVDELATTTCSARPR